MKRTTIILLVLMISCAKDPQINTSGSATKPSLTFSKTDVKIAEPLLATTSGQTAGSVVYWTTNENGHVGVSVSTDSAFLVFTNSGTYTVTATYSSTNGAMPYDSISATITVNDSIYNSVSPTPLNCGADSVKSLLRDDELTVSPILTDTGLVFVATSKKIYGNSAFLNASVNLPGTGGIYEVDLDSTLNYVCYGSSIPGQAYSIISLANPSNGNYTLVLKLNGITYQGSFRLADTGITITWNYTQGVIFSPLTVKK